MIILFDEAEVEFNTLGLGVLNDAKSGVVTEGLNDIFEFKVEYPITGSNYSKLKIGRILFAKPNPYDSMQPFRIAAITKPIKGIVSILCYHISYDTNGIPCKAIKANSLSEALQLIKENSIVDNNFDLTTDVSFSRKFETTAPYNVRALLMGDEKESLIGVYNSEIKFNKFSIILMSKRGKNRGAKVTYGCNMTDLNHETTNERLFNGVFPYYHKEQESTETVSEDTFTKAYIVGSKPFQDGWLSFSKDGDPYHPVDSTPVQIATEGEYEEKVYSWNSIYQRYDEKIYNESVTLIEGIIEPSWISIDWSRFPNVVCKANAKGYFKSSTDADWGALKGVGDVIFEGNVLTSGLTNMANNMIIYYSEVLPPNHSSSSETTITSVDVMLDDPVIWLSTTDAKTMKYNKILSLDLTNEFEEEPTKDKLKSKAEEYIVKNLVGTVKHTTTVSFIDLASTSEKEKYKNFDHIELGDTVQVSYKDLGVDVELRVISTEYDVIKDRYISVELGEKKNKFSGESVQNGDNISSLSNDVGYTDITTVNKLIADTITADYLQAVNATMSKAQIEYLQVAKISCPGILEASQLVLDQLVATLLIADNAKIASTLEAGQIKVAGDISITSGSINITDNGSTSFIVDREGNVTANSVDITGGSLNINDGMFEVTSDGTMSAKNAYIEGEIIATSGTIGGCQIIDGVLQVSAADITELSANKIIGGVLSSSEIYLKDDNSDVFFRVDTLGNVTANSVDITGGSLNINDGIFKVTADGNVTANSITISGGSIKLNSSDYSSAFEVDEFGNLKSNSITLEGGSIENLTITGNLYFGDNILKAYELARYVHHITAYYSDANLAICFDLETNEGSSLVDESFSDIQELLDSGFSGDIIIKISNGNNKIANVSIRKYDEATNKMIFTATQISDQLVSSLENNELNLDSIENAENRLKYIQISENEITIQQSNTDYSLVEYASNNNGLEISTIQDSSISFDDAYNFVITDDQITQRPIKKSDWLSYQPYEPGVQRESLIPSANQVYNVYDSFNHIIGFYIWDSNINEYVDYDLLYYINETGIRLPGLESTIYSTKIGGFTVDSNSLVSSTTTKEVGLSSDSLSTYAIWAGKADTFGEHPFSVTYTGDLYAKTGKISSYNMYNAFVYHSETLGDVYDDILSTNINKINMYDNQAGISITSLGIGLYDDTSCSKVTISQFTGITTPTIFLDPYRKAGNWRQDPFQLGTLPLLFGNIETASNMEYMASMFSDEYPDVDYLSIDTVWNMQHTCYINICKGLIIPSRSSKTICYGKNPNAVTDPSAVGYVPPDPLYDDDIQISMAFVVNITTINGSHTSATLPTVAIDETDNIIVLYNDNSFDVTVNLLVLFTNVTPLPVIINPNDPWSRIKK